MSRERLITQVNATLLDEFRALAARDGVDLEVAIDEALRDLIAKRRLGTPRSDVLTAFGSSLAEYEALYRKLAK